MGVFSRVVARSSSMRLTFLEVSGGPIRGWGCWAAAGAGTEWRGLRLHLSPRMRDCSTSNNKQAMSLAVYATASSHLMAGWSPALLLLLLLLAVVPTSQRTPEVPLFYVNLDRATDRKEHMEKNVLKDAPYRRIRATTSDDIKRLQDSTDIFQHIKLVDTCLPGGCWKNHFQEEFLYTEMATVYSHLRAISAAAETGAPYAVVMEDDVLLARGSYSAFSADLRVIVDQAPEGWGIVQLVTNQPHLLRQMASMQDLFVPWSLQAYSTGGYVINRAGMKDLSRYAAGRAPGGELLFRLPSTGIPADFLLYNSTRTYVATHPLLKLSEALSRSSSIQQTKEKSVHSDAAITLSQMIRPVVPPQPILTGLRILGCQLVYGRPSLVRKTLRSALRLFSSHRMMFAEIRWVFHIQRTGNLPIWDQIMSELKAFDGIQVDIELITETGFVNKWNVYHKSSVLMPQYDLVLLLDIDMDLSGFAIHDFFARWRTLLPTVPVIAGVPYYTPTAKYKGRPPQTWGTSAWDFWLLSRRGDILGVPLDLVEHDAAFVNGPFLKWFLDRLVRGAAKVLEDRKSVRGPSMMWCGAAAQYAPFNVSCAMFPLGITRVYTGAVHHMPNPSDTQTRTQMVAFRGTGLSWMMHSEQFRRRFFRFRMGSSVAPAHFNALGIAPTYRTLRVSVVVAVHNQPEFLRFAVDQIFEQDYPIFEVLIVDDSPQSHEALVAGLPKVVYYQVEPGATLGAKRNHGCAVASGEVIVHWDINAFYSPSRIRTQVGPIVSGAAEMTVIDQQRLLLLPDAVGFRAEPSLWHYSSLMHRPSVGVPFPNTSVCVNMIP